MEPARRLGWEEETRTVFRDRPQVSRSGLYSRRGSQDKRGTVTSGEPTDIPNLEMTGVIDQFCTENLNRILEKSWILINTSPRRVAQCFLEAAAHRCAILSYTDPDCFASRFGYHVRERSIEEGLDFLLSGDRWRVLGEHGYQYVSRFLPWKRQWRHT